MSRKGIIRVYYDHSAKPEWFSKDLTPAQIRLMDNIVEVIPESKKERDKCINRGLASIFINKYKKEYDEIKADRIAMLEDETWMNISSND